METLACLREQERLDWLRMELLTEIDTSAWDWGRHLFQILLAIVKEEEVEGQDEEQGLTQM